ncbi:MAG: hypothetical protein OEZ01_13545 [Candidatus Heimdallarchaeota archaeon]|nr:hypothetical protein [Candidatus Heimdallarchaeota archaeon]
MFNDIFQPPQAKHNIYKYIMAFGIVGLNIATSVILKYMAINSIDFTLIILGFGLVAIINIIRILLWYFANNMFQQNSFYPLTSLIFPAMIFVALAFDEPIGLAQIGGGNLITIGVSLLGINNNATTLFI